MFQNHAVIRQVGQVALGELVCVGLMLAVYAAIGKFAAPVLLGGLVGGLLAILNFLFLSVTVTRAADQAEATGDAAKARLSIQASSLLRLLTLAAILFVILKAKLCDPIASVLPLVFVRPSIMLMDFFRKDGGKTK